MNMEPNNPKQEIIVSLTSFPAAIPYAVKAIKSVLAGSVLPDKVVLYLTFSQFGSAGLPEELTAIAKENPVFEIRNHEPDIRSYRKLVPTLHDFPDAVIVTVDDDVNYHPHMLRDLLRLHKKFPEAIVAHRVKRIKLDKPYKEWHKAKWYDFFLKRFRLSYNYLQTGCGGVLYPPHALKQEMIDVELFTKLAPTSDDLWFWAAAVTNGRKILPMPFALHNRLHEVGKPRELSLKVVNFKDGLNGNDRAFEAILKKYPFIRDRLKNDD